jgi:AcrR family transcriptional regulator
MSRKENAKETIERIIAVSTRLFLEKGYERTSMQDFVDALGLSKGGVFHHFKSKEDILNAVLDRQSDYTEQRYQKLIEEMEGFNGREKTMAIFEKNLTDTKIRAFDNIIDSQQRSPHFIVANMRASVHRNAPILAKLLREGVEDGSITTEFPDECAEVFFLLMNTWCDQVLFECNTARLSRRLKFIQQMMKQLGVGILSDKVVKGYIKIIKKMYVVAGGTK